MLRTILELILDHIGKITKIDPLMMLTSKFGFDTYDAMHRPAVHLSTDGCEALSLLIIYELRFI